MHTRLLTALATLLIGTAACPTFSTAQGAPARPAGTGAVLLVISSAGLDSGRTRPGFEMDELSQAYLLFTRNGYAATIASPAGGAVQADRFNRTSPYNADFLADAGAMRQLAATKRTAGLRASAYDAIFVVGREGRDVRPAGGHGAGQARG